MKEKKKRIILDGNLLSPLTVGQTALIHVRSQVFRTSLVVAILEISADRIRFETLNTHYLLKISPAPLGTISLIPEEKPICA